MGAGPFELADNAVGMSRSSRNRGVTARRCRMVALHHSRLPDHGGHAAEKRYAQPECDCHPVLPRRLLSPRYRSRHILDFARKPAILIMLIIERAHRGC